MFISYLSAIWRGIVKGRFTGELREAMNKTPTWIEVLAADTNASASWYPHFSGFQIEPAPVGQAARKDECHEGSVADRMRIGSGRRVVRLPGPVPGISFRGIWC